MTGVIAKTVKGSRKRRILSSGFGGILLSGTILLAVAQPALAGHEQAISRAEFRAMNPDMSKREFRQFYKEHFSPQGHNGRNGGNAAFQNILHGNVGQNPAAGPNAINLNNASWRENRAAHRLSERLDRNVLQDVGKSHLVRLSSGVNLDLTSTDRIIYLGGNLFRDAASVEITVGGEKKILTAGSQVTAAEYIAVKQALAGGQKVVLDQFGTASGGSVDLNAITGEGDRMRASNLVIGSGVTTYGDFGKQSNFRLLGDLTNQGSLYLLSSNGKGTHNGVVRAQDITNESGALISSVLPENLSSSGHAKRVDITLDASGKLTNLGTISSSGELTLAANTGIDNAGMATANRSVNLFSANVTNGGHIESGSGSINIDGPGTAELNVNNAGGVISALNGAINIRTPDYSGSYNNTISGGDLLSQELNLHAGSATNYVNVKQLTGSINQTGLAGHVVASTDVLNIGDTCLTGDPTFFNDGGSININGNVSVAEALTIVASGDITSGNGLTVQASNATTGFEITLIAGAKITGFTGTATGTVPSGNTGGVTLDGTASANGGSVTLGSTIITTRPTDTLSNGSGANVSIFAFKGAAVGSGRVDTASATINTGGFGTGNNGDLTVVAGGQSGDVIKIGAVNTSGGTGIGGDLTLSTAQPISSGGGSIVYDAFGVRTSVDKLIAGAVPSTGANIVMDGLNGIATVGRDVNMLAGGSISQTNGGNLFTNNIDAGVILTANGDIGDVNNNFVISGFNEFLTKAVQKKGFLPGNGLLTVVSTNGAAYIVRLATTTITLQNSSAFNDLQVLTRGAIKLDGTITSSKKAVNVVNIGGNLDINANAVISAHDFIDITNGTGKNLKPLYNVGSNAMITTNAVPDSGQGSIFVELDPKLKKTGNPPITNPNFLPKGYGVSGKSPRERSSGKVDGNINMNLVTSGSLGVISFYGNSPLILGPAINNFTGNGAEIRFTNTAKKDTLIIGPGVTITAN